MSRAKKVCMLLLSASLSTVAFSTTAYGELNFTDSYIYQTGALPESLAKAISVDIAPVTRENLWSVLLCAIGESEPALQDTDLPFLDKNQLQPNFKHFASRGFELGIITGNQEADGIYADPKGIVTKEQAAVMIAKALGLSSTMEPACKDEDSISSWAKNYVAVLLQSGIMELDENGAFCPQEMFTNRALWKALQKAGESYYLTPPTITVLADGNNLSNHMQSAFSMPMGITSDSAGNLYFASAGNSQILIIPPLQAASVYAGINSERDIYNVALGGYLDTSMVQSAFCQPSDILNTEKGLIIADAGNHAIRIIENNQVYTLAGTGKPGYQDGRGVTAQFHSPCALAADEMGNIYVSDSSNHCIRKIDSAGTVTTVAGTPGLAGFQDGGRETSLLCQPNGLAYYNGVLYIADTGNQRIRMLQDGSLKTIAGGGKEQYEGTPLYVGGWQDGIGVNARFNDPAKLATDKFGNLFITDTGNNMIRRMEGNTVDTIFGAGRPANTTLENQEDLLLEPWGIALTNDSIVVTDHFSNRILSISYYE